MSNPSLAFTGTGAVGEVASWSVTEEATPVSIGDTSGGVGSASFMAAAVADSAYLNDCSGVFTHEGRTWAGRVNSLSKTGASAQVGMESALRLLTAVRTAPPAGRFLTALATVGDRVLKQASDVAWDASGNLFIYDLGNFRIVKFAESPVGVWTQVATTAFSTAGTADGQFGGRASIACDAAGNVYATDESNNRVQKFTNALMFSAKAGTLGSGTTNYNAPTDLAYNALTGNVAVLDRGNTRVKVITTSLVYVSQSSTGLDHAVISVDASGNTVVSGNSTGPAEVLYLPSGGGSVSTPAEAVGLAFDNAGRLWRADFTLLQRTIAATGVAIDRYGSYGTDLGQFRDIQRIAADANARLAAVDYAANRVQVFTGAGGADAATMALSTVITSYVRLCDPSATVPVSYDAAIDPQVAFPGWADSVWTKLKQLCAAYQLELYYTGGTLHVGDLGARTLNISNRSVPTVAPSSPRPARAVQVINQNITAGSGLVMYDAAATGTIHTVELGKTLHTTASTGDSAVTLNFPTAVGTATIGPGQYSVQDSTGVTLAAGAWVQAGGSVSAYVGATPGTIDIFIKAPSAIAGYAGPFSLASGSGDSRTPTLSITGSGVTTDPVALTVGTGADETHVADESIRTVDVPFLGDLSRSYDAGVWCAVTEYLFGQTITFDIPADWSVAFGDYSGRVFTYDGAQYRVIKAVHTAGRVSITGAWFATVATVDAAWSGKTVGNFDTRWSTHPTRDVATTPTRT